MVFRKGVKNQDIHEFPGVLVVAACGWTQPAGKIEAEAAGVGLGRPSGDCLWSNFRTGWRPAHSGQSEVEVRRALPGNWLFSQLFERELSGNPFHPALAEVCSLQH